MSTRGVSVAGVTVADMGQNRIHTCTFFDDGGPELLCVCGGRGLWVVEEDGGGSLVVLVDDETTADVVVLRRELAVSA